MNTATENKGCIFFQNRDIKFLYRDHACKIMQRLKGYPLQPKFLHNAFLPGEIIISFK